MSRPAHLLEHDHEDLPRKQRRERARAERKALEQAAATGVARRTRMTQLGIVLAVVVVGIVVVLLASGESATIKRIAPETAAARNVTHGIGKLLAGIPQSGTALGQPTAPVTLQYYGDLECPVCRAFTIGALPSIIQKDVRGGELRVEYHSLQTATREPEVFNSQQLAALAAGKQDKMWNFIETFYHEQGEEDSGYVTESYIQGIARQVHGLNIAQWTSDRGEDALANQVQRDAQAASNAGLEGTPAFLLGRSGGTLRRFQPSSYTEPGSFEAAIDKLAKA
ncbi:MAG TPA: thioredoxin domain-containing protein [Solirubrobacteraceae bacterium]|nr:thioredoxin domain-containing protein [Solirubrobacteraceae bacterium]